MNRDKFNYIYQQDGYYLITYDNKPLVYVDLEDFDIDLDTIITREDESKELNKIIDYLLTEYIDLLDFIFIEEYEKGSK